MYRTIQKMWVVTFIRTVRKIGIYTIMANSVVNLLLGQIQIVDVGEMPQQHNFDADSVLQPNVRRRHWAGLRPLSLILSYTLSLRHESLAASKVLQAKRKPSPYCHSLVTCFRADALWSALTNNRPLINQSFSHLYS